MVVGPRGDRRALCCVLRVELPAIATHRTRSRRRARDGSDVRQPCSLVTGWTPVSSPTTISHPDLLSLVEERQREVRAFLNWANRTQVAGYSMRMLDRPDIRDAASAVEHYQNQWWGHVVFSCFGSLKSAIAVAPHFQDPPAPEVASELLAGVVFSHPKVGHHRIQPGLAGAKKALVSACGK